MIGVARHGHKSHLAFIVDLRQAGELAVRDIAAAVEDPHADILCVELAQELAVLDFVFGPNRA